MPLDALDVGPVLSIGKDTDGFVSAIKRLNADAKVFTRGSYVRIMVPRRCILTSESLELELGRSIRWPAALEQIMPSFKGRLALLEDSAEWLAVGERSEAIEK